MDKLNEIRELLNILEVDFEKFYIKGRGISSTTIRKGMQQLKVLAQEVRVDVMDTIKLRQEAKKAQKEHQNE